MTRPAFAIDGALSKPSRALSREMKRHSGLNRFSLEFVVGSAYWFSLSNSADVGVNSSNSNLNLSETGPHS
jgi:hypothetical protein